MSSTKTRGGTGILSAEAMRTACRDGFVTAPGGADAVAVQPASLDLTLGARATRVRAAFLPGRGHTVSARLEDGIGLHTLDLEGGAVLERGCVYVVELQEGLALPPDLDARANPKSSTGRIDVFVRLVVDGGDAYDTVPAGYRGKLYAEISPRTFSVLVRRGSSLNQLRLRRGDGALPDDELSARNREAPLTDGAGARIAGGLHVSVDLSDRLGPLAGWRARRHTGLIDVDRIGALSPHDYFEPIPVPADRQLILDPGEFYILASREELRMPRDLAAEMVPIDAELGAFRVHYAGFFDPGFGLETGSRAVLEVRGYDAPFLIGHGQTVARLAFERLTAPPEAAYGREVGSNYQGQGLKLSKHFAAP